MVLTGVRVGQGYDIHRFEVGRPLVLAGVTLPWDMGLAGHSDADVICHALTDALLGATALGDIGRLFPSSDARWKDASSIELLRDAAALAVEKGWRVVNADVTVILEVPRLGPYREAMTVNLEGALGAEPGAVGLKAKTNEGLGAVGEGSAIAALAVVLVERRA